MAAAASAEAMDAPRTVVAASHCVRMWSTIRTHIHVLLVGHDDDDDDSSVQWCSVWVCGGGGDRRGGYTSVSPRSEASGRWWWWWWCAVDPGIQSLSTTLCNSHTLSLSRTRRTRRVLYRNKEVCRGGEAAVPRWWAVRRRYRFITALCYTMFLSVQSNYCTVLYCTTVFSIVPQCSGRRAF